MKATEFAKTAMENGKQWIMGLIKDMEDSPMTQPTPSGGNHPLWVLGHIAYSESQLFDAFVLGKENRFPELAEMFGANTEPTANADDYPPMDELLQKFNAIREASLTYLEALSDEDLDAKAQAPEGFEGFFGTVGACYAAMSNHLMFHGGQVADARRAAGRPVLMA